MDFEFLYDRTRHLLAIGFNADDSRRDTSYYDLLASEARFTSFVAIAQGRLPQDCWFALGRLLTTADGKPVLVSWSGSMFEYLMPQLVMPGYDGTLLDQTCRAAVARQIAYGRQHSVPWGISESGYNVVDANLNYQYHAFGVPGLGLTRGLAKDLVVAPYASALALLVAPVEACENLDRLAALGMEGPFGFYEAVDYTPARVPRGQASVIVRSFMSHHQGMNLLSLSNVLLGRPMPRRFESDPAFQATLMLLQERVPKTSTYHTHVAHHAEGHAFSMPADASIQAPIAADTSTPEVQLLSNGRLHVMVTNAGGGYSRWRDLALTRWREDTTCDNWGSFIYLREVASGEYWSATHQPTLRRAESYEAMFTEGRAEFRRRDLDYETYTEIVVSPEDDIELRRLRLTNHAGVRRTIEVTSYAEVVLAPQAADALQPSFGNLFVQTEIVQERRTILCTRRPRSASDPTPWMFHLVAPHGPIVGKPTFETDRTRFLGRGRTPAAPIALEGDTALSGSDGSVLEPIVAIRCRVELDPGESATLDFVSGAADSRDACLALAAKYRDRHLANRVFDLAWTHGGVMLRQINATPDDARIYRRLAGHVVYANAALRADSGVLMRNQRGQSGLWGYAISGDHPIVLLKIADSANIELARQLIRCHAYWRLKGLVVDLVIWNEEHIGYRQRLQDQIIGLIATGAEAHAVDRPGGIFVRYAEQIANEDRVLLQAAARVVISEVRGSLVEQVNRRILVDKSVARLSPTRTHRPEPQAPPEPTTADLVLGNHLGGFTRDGSEYVITTSASQMTPAPWVNVLANPAFGTVLSESGVAYTWHENAHEFRLTPWSGDPVGSTGGETIYLRDEESGHFWSPAPFPAGGAMPYRTRHGFGYSVFEHAADGIHSELWVYVDIEDPVKYSVLKVRNGSGRTRRLSATGFVEWVLGDLRTKSAPHVVTEIDPASGALFARNAYNSEFAGRVAFLDVDDLARTLSGDRTEFLGRNGTLANPDALARSRLSGRLGAGLDPCGAIQVPFELADGEERQIIFRLGAGRSVEQARALAKRLRQSGSARAALDNVH
ncbi:MAG TPA: glucoamylase family protein, partial [Steroidobacteraceae bacterium]|nr:glucoamylase family protein [Steroidobacteraceae bacterium]